MIIQNENFQESLNIFIFRSLLWTFYFMICNKEIKDVRILKKNGIQKLDRFREFDWFYDRYKEIKKFSTYLINMFYNVRFIYKNGE